MKRWGPVEAENFGRDDLPGWAVRFLARLKPRDRAILQLHFDGDGLRGPERAVSLGLKPDTLRQARKRIRSRALREFPPEILERVGKVFAGQAWIRRRLGAARPNREPILELDGDPKTTIRADPDVATVTDCEAGMAQIDEEIAALRSEHRTAFARKDWKRVREINLRINRLRRGRKNLVVTLDYLRHPDRLKARGSLFRGQDPYTRKATR